MSSPLTLAMEPTPRRRDAGAALGRVIHRRMSLAAAGRVIGHDSGHAISRVIRGERRLRETEALALLDAFEVDIVDAVVHVETLFAEVVWDDDLGRWREVTA